MKSLKLNLSILLLLCAALSYGQVGIGNTNPQAQLDISASSTTSPTNNDGILIPRMSVLPANATMTANQDGMLVFYTGTGFSGKGFYFWDQSIPNWVYVASGTKNTLDQAYDEGGAGAGKTIVADNGAVRINGEDGFLVTGTYNTGTFIEATGSGTRMFFNPRKAAFRSGGVNGTQWDHVNIGNYSTAFGYNNIASGDYSTSFGGIASGNSAVSFGSSTASGPGSYAFGAGTMASNTNSVSFGYLTLSSGRNATAFGSNTSALSFSETTMGMFNTSYTPLNTVGYQANDRLFVIGNGTSDVARSNALTIYKSGLININDAYNMPLTDGTTNQVMATNGTGQVSFIDVSTLLTSDQDWLETGGTNTPNSINDNIYTLGDVAIGTNSASAARLQVESDKTRSIEFSNINHSPGTYGIFGTVTNNSTVNTTTARGIAVTLNGTGSSQQIGITSSMTSQSSGNISGFSSNITGNGNGLHIGFENGLSGSGTGPRYGIRNIMSFGDPSGGSNGHYGIYNSIGTGGFGERIGINNFISGSGSGSKYGTKTEINPTAGGIHYGIHSDVQKTNSYAGYFIGRASFGNTTANRYLLPSTDGTANQVMATDGAGQVSFMDASTLVTTTDNQNITGSGLSGTDLTIGIENGSSQIIDLSSLQDGNTQNTLDQAYDEGGPGAGKTINADNGAVTINGLDGFIVTGAFGGGNTIDTEVIGAGTRMFFNPLRSAFRAGTITDNRWSDASIGLYSNAFGFNTTASGTYSSAIGQNTTASGSHSFAYGFNTTASGNHSFAFGSGTTTTSVHDVAFGVNTTASGGRSTAFGSNTIANGINSTAFGSNTIAPSAFETVIGTYNTTYTANSTTLFNNNDRLFVIGNGIPGNRSNALTIYKSGLMNINDEYNMPLTDGTANQVMTTDGAGQVSFVDASAIFTDTDDQTLSLSGNTLSIADGNSVNLSAFNTGGDITNVTAGTGLIGGGTTGAVTLNAVATNGLTTNANDIRLGGTLIQDTNITYGNFDTRFNLNGTGDFIVQDDGAGVFTINDAGNTFVARNMVWRETSIAGTNIGDMLTDGNDGRFIVRENGTISVDLDANTQFVFNEQGLDRDFRIESSSLPNMFRVDAANNRIGVNTDTPDGVLDIEGNSTGTVAQLELTETAANDGARIRFNNSFETNNQWTIYGRADDTVADSRFNIFHNGTGNVIVATGNGNVGIARVPVTNRFEVAGNASKAVAGNWLANSDSRLKKSIQTLESNHALNKLLQLRGVTYEWNDTKTGIERPEGKQYGFIAQELMQVFPEKVTKDNLGYYQTAYGDYDALFVQAIKALNTKVEVLEKENNDLRLKLKKYETLEARLTALENDKNH